jgi:23S rRNA G2069 N7-methylase RlmK/C1962 C5-methylase RlmI
LEPEEFRSLLRIASGRAKKDVRIVDWLPQPVDHAERLAFPEGRYLKTAILEIESSLSFT